MKTHPFSNQLNNPCAVIFDGEMDKLCGAGNPDSFFINVIYLITDEPDFYADYVMAQADPSLSTLTRKEFFAGLAKPLVNARAKI